MDVEYKKWVEKETKETFWGNKLHGNFIRKVSEVSDERLWHEFRAGYRGKSTEGYLLAAQEQPLQTRPQYY